MRALVFGPLSISHRLALAFLMVLVLAVAVNVLIARGPRILHVQTSTTPAPQHVAAPAQSIRQVEPAIAVAQPNPSATATERRASEALREFEAVVLQQYSDQGGVDTTAIRTAGRGLELAVADVFPGGVSGGLRHRLSSLQAEGLELGSLAARRRVLLASSAGHLSALDSQAKVALDG